jgi:hypothetical protein
MQNSNDNQWEYSGRRAVMLRPTHASVSSAEAHVFRPKNAVGEAQIILIANYKTQAGAQLHTGIIPARFFDRHPSAPRRFLKRMRRAEPGEVEGMLDGFLKDAVTPKIRAEIMDQAPALPPTAKHLEAVVAMMKKLYGDDRKTAVPELVLQ